MAQVDELLKDNVRLGRCLWYLEQKLNTLGYKVDYASEVPAITRKDTDDDQE